LFWINFIFQLWTEHNCTIIAISSKESDPTKFNFFDLILESPNFNTYAVSEICEICQSKKEIECIHNFKYKSATKSEHKKKLIEGIIPESEKERFLAEQYSIKNTLDTKFFTKNDIDLLFNEKIDISDAKIKKLILSVDPSGGTSDRMGISVVADCFIKDIGSIFSVYFLIYHNSNIFLYKLIIVSFSIFS